MLRQCRRREMVKSQGRHIWNITSVENPDLPHFASNFTMTLAALPTLLLRKTGMWHGNMHVAWQEVQKAADRQWYSKVSPAALHLTHHWIKHWILAYLLHVYTMPIPQQNPLYDTLSCKQLLVHRISWQFCPTYAHTSIPSLPIPHDI